MKLQKCCYQVPWSWSFPFPAWPTDLFLLLSSHLLSISRQQHEVYMYIANRVQWLCSFPIRVHERKTNFKTDRDNCTAITAHFNSHLFNLYRVTGYREIALCMDFVDHLRQRSNIFNIIWYANWWNGMKGDSTGGK